MTIELIVNIFSNGTWGLVLAFFAVAFLYSSVGFGGGSSYLALLALYGIAYTDLRFIALVCNIVVVSGSVVLYYRNGFYKNSRILSLVAFSVPLAFVGGMVELDERVFFIILAFTLILAALLMWIRHMDQDQAKLPKSHAKNTVIGGLIGFLSGLVGIGGGIFLSPYLNLTKYDTAIRIAAFSSFFILVNSIAGILGQAVRDINSMDFELTIYLIIAVFLGGQIGVRFGIKKLSPTWIKRITSVLILVVGIKLLLENIL